MKPYIEQASILPQEELEKLSKSDKNATFLHQIARYSRNPKVLRDQIMAILLAGRDTTAATLSWTIYELAHYPEIYAKLRNEIIATVGESRAPTYADLKSMTYLTHTLNETLRLYPAVPYNLRAALEDTTLPGQPGQPDIAVLKDDVVLYSTFAMQRRADIYPPTSEKFADPAIFSPDRWDHWTPKAWTYVPFNGGPRICVGQNFAVRSSSLPPSPRGQIKLYFRLHVKVIMETKLILISTDDGNGILHGSHPSKIRAARVSRGLARTIPQSRSSWLPGTWRPRCVLREFEGQRRLEELSEQRGVYKSQILESTTRQKGVWASCASEHFASREGLLESRWIVDMGQSVALKCRKGRTFYE